MSADEPLSSKIIEDVLTELSFHMERPGVITLFRRIQEAARNGESATKLLKAIGAAVVPRPPSEKGVRHEDKLHIAWYLVTGMAHPTEDPSKRLYNLRTNVRPDELRTSDADARGLPTPEAGEMMILDFGMPSKFGKQLFETLLERIRAGKFHLPHIPSTDTAHATNDTHAGAA